MPWHSDPAQDLEARRQMINLIANYLEKRHPRTAEVQDSLVATARKLEVALYKACKTKQEYMETRSLARRIRELERTGNFSIEQSLGPAPQPAATAPAATTPATTVTNSSPGNGTASLTTASSNPTSHAEVLKQRRNRLLVLKHASKCQAEDGKCNNSWCSQMKKLWNHVAQCKTPDCTYPHCVSSHYVLNHYHKCRDPACAVCGQVRDPAARKKLEQAEKTALSPTAARQSDGTEAVLTTRKPSTVSQQIDPKFARGSKDGSGPSLPLSMNRQAVQQHLDSLKVEQHQQAFFPLLRKLMENTKLNPMGLFNVPVDDRDVPGYSTVISKPMDLGSIRRKLDEGKYRRLEDFESDVNLVFRNAMTFNPKNHRVHAIAAELQHIFDTEMRKIKQKLDDPSTVPRKGGVCPLCKQVECTQCELCNRGCIAYEPKILFCAGGCENSRIARNATFYSLPGSMLNWCSECFEKRKLESYVTDVNTGTKFEKGDLVKRKHDELFSEPWVYCDTCHKWSHQLCALFNFRKQDPSNKDEKYMCPKCLIAHKEPVAPKISGAEDLEHTKLSKFLEMWVRVKLSDALQHDQRLGKIQDAPTANSVTIRVLSNYDETFPVKTYAKTVCGFPESITYRSRAIFLFQHLDGVDVLLFVMYVQEYGADAPPPNRNKVYIAYLDSVHFFRPRQHRTLVYHELLLSYLEYARRQGFTSCYIWACPPPTKKDDYILHCHPEDQRVPSHERLRQWYHEMIKEGVKERIVLSSCALFEEHYDSSFVKKPVNSTKKKEGKTGKGKKATALTSGQPQSKNGGNAGKAATAAMEIEAPIAHPPPPSVGYEYDDVLADFMDDDLHPSGSATPALPPPTTPASDTATPAPRSAGSPSGDDDEPLFIGIRKSELEAMDKDDVISAEKRRQHKLATKFQMPVFDGDYWPNEMEDVVIAMARQSKTGGGLVPAKGKGKGSSRKSGEDVTMESLVASGEINTIDAKAVLNRIGESLEGMRADFLVVKLAHECFECGKYLLRGRWECRHPDCLNLAGFNRPNPFALCEECFAHEVTKPSRMQHGGEAQRAKPHSPAPTVNSDHDMNVVENAAAAVGEQQQPTVKKERNDDDDTTGGSESEDKKQLSVATPPSQQELLTAWEKQPLRCTRKHFDPSSSHQLVFVDEELPLSPTRSDKTFKNHLLETRHAFLSLCTGNRYAFNQLRRAKHTTMMILYHLHNPDAPAHLHQCNICHEDIILGWRYNCAICQGGDYDLCESCYRAGGHPHRLTKIEVTRTVDQEASESKRKKGMEKRRQRKRSLQVFLSALVHASSCTDADCSEVACSKMKELLSHRTSCTVRVRGGCEICRRVLCLVQMHAKGSDQMAPCTRDPCPVPHCDDLKRHLRQRNGDGSQNGTTPRPSSGSSSARAPKNGRKTNGAPMSEGTKKKSKTLAIAPAANGTTKKKKTMVAPVASAPNPSEGLKVKLKRPMPAIAKPPEADTAGVVVPIVSENPPVVAAPTGDDESDAKKPRLASPKERLE